jgi:hypothetical protein
MRRSRSRCRVSGTHRRQGVGHATWRGRPRRACHLRSGLAQPLGSAEDLGACRGSGALHPMTAVGSPGGSRPWMPTSGRRSEQDLYWPSQHLPSAGRQGNQIGDRKGEAAGQNMIEGGPRGDRTHNPRIKRRCRVGAAVSILSTGSRICVASSGTWSGVVVAAAFPRRSQSGWLSTTDPRPLRSGCATRSSAGWACTSPVPFQARPG